MVPDAARHADNFGTILVGILWSRQRRTTLNPSYSVCFRRTCALLRSRRARFWTQSESKNTRKIGRRSTYRGRRSENEKYTRGDRKSTRLNSSHTVISYAVFCLKKKKKSCCI